MSEKSKAASPKVGGDGRMDVLRHLFTSQQFRESLALAGQPYLRNSALSGLQTALAGAIALSAFLLFGGAHLVGFAALGALVPLFGRFAPEGGRPRILLIAAALQVMSVLIMSLVSWLGASEAVQLALLSLLCGLLPLICMMTRLGIPGPMIFVFAAAAAMTPDLSLQMAIERGLATGLVALLAVLICLVTEGLRDLPNAERRFPVETVPPMRLMLPIALRAMLAAMIVGFISRALGAGHPEWAAMGALAVLQVPHLHLNMSRAVQRICGTLAGAAITWVILLQDPTSWTIVAIIVGLQVLAELVIGINYALGLTVITPMALLMTHLASPTSAGARMAPERILDTLFGVVIALLIAVVLSSLADRRALAQLRRG